MTDRLIRFDPAGLTGDLVIEDGRIATTDGLETTVEQYVRATHYNAE